MRDEPIQRSNSSSSGWVRLNRWGEAQHRQVTTAQLRAIGWESNDVAYRVQRGLLHPVYAEVYSLGGPPQTEKEWWMAATLTFGPGTRLSDSAAAELYGWLRYPLNEIHVTTPTEHRPRQGLIPHCRSRSVEWRTIDHIPVTSPEQTILDCATTMKSDSLFRRIVRQAQAERATSHVRLLLLTSQSAGVRGVARLRAELEDGPAPTTKRERGRGPSAPQEPGQGHHEREDRQRRGRRLPPRPQRRHRGAVVAPRQPRRPQARRREGGAPARPRAQGVCAVVSSRVTARSQLESART